MRKYLALSVLALSLLTASASPLQSSDPTVYKTRTGAKYHLGWCSYLRQSKISIKLSAAKREGLTACSRCDPPR